jgi:hypothetical protein
VDEVVGAASLLIPHGMTPTAPTARHEHRLPGVGIPLSASGPPVRTILASCRGQGWAADLASPHSGTTSGTISNQTRTEVTKSRSLTYRTAAPTRRDIGSGGDITPASSGVRHG